MTSSAAAKVARRPIEWLITVGPDCCGTHYRPIWRSNLFGLNGLTRGEIPPGPASQKGMDLAVPGRISRCRR